MRRASLGVEIRASARGSRGRMRRMIGLRAQLSVLALAGIAASACCSEWPPEDRWTFACTDQWLGGESLGPLKAGDVVDSLVLAIVFAPALVPLAIDAVLLPVTVPHDLWKCRR